MTAAKSFHTILNKRHGLSGVEEIGRGGMGVVYKAYDPNLERFVAVKQLNTELISDSSAPARFTSEMKTLARVSHSAVVSIHTTGITEDGNAYFIMDYVEGANLADVIRNRKQWNKAFSIDEVVDYLHPIALALDHLHLKMDPPIIHRDVKPANILVPSENSGETRTLLTDFGISLTEDDTRYTSLSMVVGTERYTAPELFPGHAPSSDDLKHSTPDAASDNYSLALIALEMLTMHSLKDTMSTDQWTSSERPFPRFHDMDLPAISPTVLKNIEEVFRKALKTEPAYRHRTASEFIRALAQADNSWGTADKPSQSLSSEWSISTQPEGMNQQVKTSSPSTAAKPPVKKGSWVTIGALGVLTIALAGSTIGLIAYTAQHPAWEDEEALIAAAFPDVIPSLENGDGWGETTCAAGVAQEDQKAQIICSNEELSITYIDYGTASARNVAFSEGEDPTEWDGNNCSLQSTAIGETTYSIIPSDPVARFAAVIESDDADARRQEVPLC